MNPLPLRFAPLLLFLASCGATDRASRRQPVVVEYDFRTSRYLQERQHPWIHQPVVFKVSGINRLAYHVEISSRDSVLAESEAGVASATEAPASAPEKSGALEAALDLIASAQPKTAQPANVKKNDSAKADSQNTATIQAVSLQNNIATARESLAAKTKTLDSVQRQQNKPLDTPSGPDSLDAIARRKQEIAALDTYVANAEADIKQIKKRITEDSARLRSLDSSLDAAHRQYVDLRESLDKLYRRAARQYADIWRSYRLYNDLKLLAANPNTSLQTVKSCDAITRGIKWRDFEQQRQTAADFFETVAEYRQQYEVFANKDLNVLAAAGMLNRLNAPVAAQRLRIEKMMEDIRPHKPFDIITLAEELHRKMLDSATYYVISPPIQPSADVVVFDVNIVNKHTAEFHDSRRFMYHDFVRGGLRYDFSTGVVFNLAGARDENFWLRSVDTNGNVQIHRNANGSEFVPQLAGMFHASIRSRNIVNVGFTLGASINTETFDVGSIFPGLSLMIGRRNKAVITAGPALKKVHRLKSNLEEGGIYPGAQLQADDLTDEVFRVGSFIGISYNLTSRQKSKFKL